MENRKLSILIISCLCLLTACTKKDKGGFALSETSVSKVWVPDNGDGTYTNPVVNADYSDPDVIRVGEDYFMISSSFNCVPGIPILQSKDLVNWTIVGHVFNHQKPLDKYQITQHGKGVWAPSIRFHYGFFYIYYPDPDHGIYMTKSEKPQGPWSEPVLIEEGKGLIDPCPFWDDDGKAYLVHAWAGSRAGIKSIITLNRMSEDGTQLLDDGVMIIDGHGENPTIEGPKFYKSNGYYYIFAPAGGVTHGWQLVLRSKNIYGPYESKIVLQQGNTSVNGPHQGAWVETEKGEHWFVHFQDKGAYGRVVHLQPMTWSNGWPVIGIDANNDGIGEPVQTYKKPATAKSFPIVTPQSSDEFNNPKFGLQWQWQANYQPTWGYPTANLGYLRLNAIPLAENVKNFWDVSNLLLQKFTAEKFTATAKIDFYPANNGDKAGLIVMGEDYSYISVMKKSNTLYVGQTVCLQASKEASEVYIDSILIPQNSLYLRVVVSDSAKCHFGYSTDSINFLPIGQEFIAKQGKWIGAKVGLFCNGVTKTNDAGYANIDWFRVE